jgi:hypothetical protein
MNAAELASQHARWDEQYKAALRGKEPAEALPTHLRWQLVAHLHEQGLTDLAIAIWTRQTVYTTTRIRRGLGLESNVRTDTLVLPFEMPFETGRHHHAAPAAQAQGAA